MELQESQSGGDTIYPSFPNLDLNNYVRIQFHLITLHVSAWDNPTKFVALQPENYRPL
jgi:hypothetical protein